MMSKSDVGSFTRTTFFSLSSEGFRVLLILFISISLIVQLTDLLTTRSDSLSIHIYILFYLFSLFFYF